MIKLKQKFIIYALGLLFILTGCIQDGFFGNTPGADEDPLTFTFIVDGITTNSTTRATISPQVDETTVKTLHLLFFEYDEEKKNWFYSEVVSLPSIPTDPAAGKLTMETSYVLPTTGSVNASTPYHIIGIANLGKYVDDVDEWLGQWTGVTEAFFRDNATIEREGTDDDTDYEDHRPITLDKLLMNGFVDKPASTKNIQMVLSRNVARFDVELKEQITSTNKLKTVSIWNAFTKSSITGDAPFNYSSEDHHTKRFYGIKTDEKKSVGGLYAFANYSETPSINDKLTTNLIVGLSRNEGATTYYRINVNSNGTSQLLKNNYAYNITIVDVVGDGYPTEEEAWEGTTNQLVYVVNNWNLDDNGLIVSDEYSLLAVPVKTVKIAKEGSESSYSITTFSTLENPEPLRIKSQIYDPTDGNITARISNGNLIINARPMNTGQEKRTGIITISYAGLETSVNVIQTAAGDVYLEVTLDEGWKEFLPPTANAMSEFINVKASGAWTARLYGSTNFSFQNTLGSYVKQISSIEYTNNKFHVYTSNSNESRTITEKGFVLITLDSDPDNYVSVVPVNQASKGSIDVNPVGLSSIRFFGSQKLETSPDMYGDTKDKTHFAFKVTPSGTIAEGNVRLTGKDIDKFGFEFNVATNIITVWAKEKNPQVAYNATLYVSDNRNGNLLVSLYQGTSQLDVEAPAPSRSVPATGGDSDPILISMEGGQWTATIETVTNGSKEIKNHYAKLMVVGGGELAAGVPTNKNLYVKFPKVYFPNRETKIKAIVTITPIGGGNPKTVEVYQDALVAKTLNSSSVWSLQTTAYGGLSNGYADAYNAAVKSYFVGDFVADLPSTFYPPATRYTHLGNSFLSGFNMKPVVDYQKDIQDGNVLDEKGNIIDGIIVITNDNTGSISQGKTSQLIGNNATYVYLATYPRTSSGMSSSRIGNLISNNGSISASFNNLGGGEDWNTTASCITNLSSISSTAVQILRDNAGNTVMYIDPVKKIAYIGECQVFDHYRGDNRTIIMNNFIQYVINCAKYGSHFNDLLIDGFSEPAPWDGVWGSNAWRP